MIFLQECYLVRNFATLLKTINDNEDLALGSWFIKDNFLELLQILIKITNLVAFKLFCHIKRLRYENKTPHTNFQGTACGGAVGAVVFSIKCVYC